MKRSAKKATAAKKSKTVATKTKTKSAAKLKKTTKQKTPQKRSGKKKRAAPSGDEVVVDYLERKMRNRNQMLHLLLKD